MEKPSGIIWIASYPKSGNTWTRSFLHNLINVLSGDAEEAHDINAMNVMSAWEIAAPPYEAALGKKVTNATREEIAAVRHRVQSELAGSVEGLAFVKTHHALVMDRGATTLNFDVTSGAIYIVRNPLDVAISFAHHMGTDLNNAIAQMGKTGLETAIGERAVYEVYGSWSQHVESWTRNPHRTVHVMRYEDMLTDPHAAFGALARHLLLTPTKTQLDRAVELSSFEKLKAQEEQNSFREKPIAAERFFRAGKEGQWREVLTGEQITRIVTDHELQMRRFGYWPDAG
ncbi:MAG: sulfotransferase domain-containing protein [Pseudomonadota bacterium]